jgi:RimJ/RimL family protein N-acetyltransferase
MADRIRYPVRPLRFRFMNQVVRFTPTSEKYCHNSILLRKFLDDEGPAIVPDGYQFRLGTQEDLEFMINHPEALSSQVYINRLKRGDKCYCLCDGQGILSYNWIATSACCVLCGFPRGLEFFTLRQGQAFTYDFYTYKAHRRDGLGKLTKMLLLRTLFGNGVREVYSLVMPYGTASLKIHLRLGYESVSMVYGYRIMGWSRTYFGRPEHRARLDRWICEFKSAHGIV